MAKNKKDQEPMIEENSSEMMLEETTNDSYMLEETPSEVLLEESSDGSTMLEESSTPAMTKKPKNDNVSSERPKSEKIVDDIKKAEAERKAKEDAERERIAKEAERKAKEDAERAKQKTEERRLVEKNKKKKKRNNSIPTIISIIAGIIPMIWCVLSIKDLEDFPWWAILLLGLIVASFVGVGTYLVIRGDEKSWKSVLYRGIFVVVAAAYIILTISSGTFDVGKIVVSVFIGFFCVTCIAIFTKPSVFQ